MMDLRDFVAETLRQIVDGVRGAQEAVGEHGAFVNPRLLGTQHSYLDQGLAPLSGGGFAQIVQFDVALSATEGTGTRGGIALSVGAVTLGSAGQSNAETNTLNRVKFCIPLSLPESNAGR